MTPFAPLLAVGAVLAAAVALRPRLTRPLPVLPGRGHRDRSGVGWMIGGLGRRVRRGCGRPPDAAADRRLGMSLVVGVALLPAGWPLAGLVGLGAWTVPALWAWRARRRRRDDVLGQLPDVADLLLVGVEAGLTVRLALGAVATGVTGIVAETFEQAVRDVERGCRVADALDGLTDLLGDPVRPVVEVLLDAERYGTPLREPLERVAAELRLERRRRAEEAARRVPVKLLFPLVFCTLPAFGLLTVVPLLASTFPSLPR